MTFWKDAEDQCLAAEETPQHPNSPWPAEVRDMADKGGVGVARTPEALAAVARLRYDLFVARDGKQYAFADHDSGGFVEPVDRLSLNFWAHSGDTCLAAVRLTRADDALGCPHLAELVAQADLDFDEFSAAVINSRMVVRDSQQARLRVPLLFRTIYHAGLVSGARYSLIATRPALMPLFERFGFLARSKGYIDPIAGTMVLMMLDAHDREHLRAVDSPLVKTHNDIFGLAPASSSLEKAFA